MADTNGTTAIAVRQNAAIAQRDDLDSVMQLGQMLYESGFYKDVRSQAQAVAKILTGREFGLGPAQSLSGIYIVEGKPAMSANTIAAAIKLSKRFDYRVRNHDNETCELEAFELIAGEWVKVGESTFTRQDAITAGLVGKDVWKKYPRNMLFSRALTNLARWYCASVFISGIYTPDELSDEFTMEADGTYRRIGPPSTDTTPAGVLADQLEADPAVAKARELATRSTAQRAPKAGAPAPVDVTVKSDTPAGGITREDQEALALAARDAGWTKEEVFWYLKAACGYESTREIAASMYPVIMAAIGDPQELADVRAQMSAETVPPSQVPVDDEGRVIA